MELMQSLDGYVAVYYVMSSVQWVCSLIFFLQKRMSMKYSSLFYFNHANEDACVRILASRFRGPVANPFMAHRLRTPAIND